MAAPNSHQLFCSWLVLRRLMRCDSVSCQINVSQSASFIIDELQALAKPPVSELIESKHRSQTLTHYGRTSIHKTVSREI